VPMINKGDPWFNDRSSIARTGTGYVTDHTGYTNSEFEFDTGYGFDDAVGKVSQQNFTLVL